MAPSGVIGKDGKLPWHLPAEFAHFKRMTMGKPVIMGRKTFESLGGKALPGREIRVVSKSGLSLEKALEQAGDAPEVMIAGGAEIYAQCLSRATHMILSVLDQDYEGDTFFPAYDFSQWHLDQEEICDSLVVKFMTKVPQVAVA